MSSIRYIRRAAALICAASTFLAQFDAAHAESTLIAVATNFAEVVAHLKPVFEAATGHHLTVTTGSTGKLYAQITNGAPFDAFLAADQKRPELLEERGLAAAGTRITYAHGHLSLWSADADLIGDDGAAILAAGNFNYLAIANPDLAPYGIAARQALIRLDLWENLGNRIVMGQNIGQTFAMVASGNAELGFVAKSYAESARNGQAGSSWHLPQQLYDPIRQDAVLLAYGAKNIAAIDFLEFLQSDTARYSIDTFGYSTGLP